MHDKLVTDQTNQIDNIAGKARNVEISTKINIKNMEHRERKSPYLFPPVMGIN